MTQEKKHTAEQQKKRDRLRFLLTNMTRGWAWLGAIIGIFLVLELVQFDYYKILTPLYDQPFWLYGSFVVSEVFFGIIPPEFYMVWARGYGNPAIYVEIVVLLAAISYGAGIIGYYIGRTFSHTGFYRKLAAGKLQRVNPLLKKYGLFLIVVAALTPVPFSASCMLVGSVRYPFGKFLLASAFRFLRFGLYGFVVWKSTGL
ncbi:MAG: VTT domain-containing protein [Chlorobi bacterium]|nr:VTT domain-containing protein [Chlorobiota bacterium]